MNEQGIYYIVLAISMLVELYVLLDWTFFAGAANGWRSLPMQSVRWACSILEASLSSFLGHICRERADISCKYKSLIELHVRHPQRSPWVGLGASWFQEPSSSARSLGSLLMWEENHSRNLSVITWIKNFPMKNNLCQAGWCDLDHVICLA